MCIGRTPSKAALLLPLLWLVAAPAVTAVDVERQLVQDIQSAERRLGNVEQDIAAQSASLTRALAERQTEVEQLRREAAAIQRAADEQTLSLESLRTRLQRWSDQANYQRNVLTDYFRRSEPMNRPDVNDLPHNLRALEASISALDQTLRPQWREGTLIRDSGYIEPAQLLTLGPVTWYWQTQTQSAGLAQLKGADAGGDSATVALAYSGSKADGVAELYRNGAAEVVFDPGLDRAARMAGVEESTWQHVAKGGIWVLPILFFGLLALAIAVLKAVQFIRLPKVDSLSISRLMVYLQKAQGGNKPPDDQLPALRHKVRGAAADMFEIALTTPVSQHRDDRLFSRLLQSRQYLERFLGAIAVTAAVAPLLGLLGTVSGMIETFKLMTVFGAGDPAAVSGGISEALVTTELGLIVAIPALVLHALLSRRARHYESELEKCAIELSKLEVTT